MHVFLELQSLSGTQGVVITPDNLDRYASVIHSSVSIRDRLIHFGSGFPEVEFLKFPLGKIRPYSTIKVTVGLKPRPPNVDSDPVFELSDGTKYNRFTIVDPTNFHDHSPCFARRASQDNTLVPTGTKQGSIYQMIFEPKYGYGACTAGYDNGYINSARFDDKLDIDKDLSLVVSKDNDYPEDYDFYFFIIEIV